MKQHLKTLLVYLVITLFSSIQSVSAIEFVFNGFKPSDMSAYGYATIESRILSLSTLSGMRFGMVFLFVPHIGTDGASSTNSFFSKYINNGDPNNNAFGVEFDIFKDLKFNDMNDNHVGIDVNSFASVFAHEAGYWPAKYNKVHINVTLAPVGMKRPKQPLLDCPLNLSQDFKNEMYVGFSASSRDSIQGHRILAWSFSNSNFSIGDALITQGLPSFALSKDPVYKGFIAEDWELEYWPHRISYQVIDAATNGFADENVIGMGGNGKVYKGVLAGGSEVAVKCIHENSEGERQFLAEISSLGRLKHRNLVALRGWCKKGRGSLILVYDYMENGSLDKRLFECDVRNMLSFGDRIKILKDVASGVLYLHEEWEAKVLHRDIKARNVLLDKEMHARIGGFGLARMHDHGQVANATQVVGTRLHNQLRTDQGFNEEEALRVLQLGMICASLDPKARPTMRQVVKFFEKNREVDESEAEDIDVYLRTNAMLPSYCSSISVSWINSLVVGR
ncbi:hypothetical protein HAX54_050333 [Datura stramonium]|uniref:Protein kinase domain-containing protein n=1 Tax=Datura stramonium TaxID=4076 RepID=A0ABS8WL92_DATST|nr:hypothetical protein [Datura stramonium]